MYKKLLYGIAISSMLFMFSCGGETTENANPEETEIDEVMEVTGVEEVDETPSKVCRVTSYSFKLGDAGRTVNFYYEDGKTTKVTMDANGQNQELNYTYDDQGRLSTFTMEGNTGTYVYEGDRLMAINGDGNLNTRTMEYDENGNIVKQITMFGDSPYMTHEFTYEGNVPVKVKMIDKSGTALEESEIIWDDAPNPFAGQAVFLNSTEMMMGYPIGNYAKSIKSIKKTYLKATNYKVNGEKKNEGDVDIDDKTYEYNEDGYITAQIQTRGDQEIRSEIGYECD